MDRDRDDLAALSLLAYLGSVRETLGAHGYAEFSGPLIDAYHDVTGGLYDQERFAEASAALARATELAAGDSEMLAMLGEGPIRSWLGAGDSRVLRWAATRANTHSAWQEALGSVALFYAPELDAELRALSRHLRAVWDLPDR